MIWFFCSLILIFYRLAAYICIFVRCDFGWWFLRCFILSGCWILLVGYEGGESQRPELRAKLSYLFSVFKEFIAAEAVVFNFDVLVLLDEQQGIEDGRPCFSLSSARLLWKPMRHEQVCIDLIWSLGLAARRFNAKHSCPSLRHPGPSSWLLAGLLCARFIILVWIHIVQDVFR